MKQFESLCGVLLRSVNRYKDRLLPHLIGSVEFHADDTLGLREGLSDEETDEFLSVSDKGYDDSEDSDIESDQKKREDMQGKKENISRPLVLGLPEGLGGLQPSSAPTGEMFGEPDNDLFTEPSGRKPMFSNWQPSDLWAPEEDQAQKTQENNSGNYRPPSAASSVSSAQSSNISEPVKKTIEDFGKSGSGRLPVFVQEDQTDLFDGAADAQLPAPKRNIPAGGVKLFYGDINPFTGRNQANKDAVSEEARVPSKQTRRDSWDNDEEDDIFSKTQNKSDNILPRHAPSSNLPSKKKTVDLFNDSESEDDLFSNKPKPVMPFKNTENQLKNDEHIKNISSLSAKSQPHSVIPKDNFVSKSVIPPFSETAKETEVEDDEDGLFSNKSIFSDKKSQLSHRLFSDDLFKNESDDLFSSNDFTNQKAKTDKNMTLSKGAADDLFSEEKSQLPFSKSESNAKQQSSKVQNVFEKNLFTDDNDLFGDVANSRDSDLFGTSHNPQKRVNISQNKQQDSGPSVSKPFSKDLFDDDDDVDLFSSTSNKPKISSKVSVEDDMLFHSKAGKPFTSEKQTVDANAEKDLFSSSKPPVEAPKENSKGKQISLKSKKVLGRQSLFDSDSDDDLFSSPQGSLSSRKSWQTSNERLEPSDKKPANLFNKEQLASKASKTDFSSIFSNNINEEKSYSKTSRPLVAPSNDIFGEDEDLFSKSNVNLKTPDLFKEPPSENIPDKLHKPSNNPVKDMTVSDVNTEFNLKSEKKVEAVNPQLIDSIRTKISDTDCEPVKTDILDKILVRPKKPEPPKSLAIKPITETVSSDVPPLFLEEERAPENIPKPSVPKKPSSNTSINNSTRNDVPDGEILPSSSPSKEMPGKLKGSQLININTAALLPGAKPRPKHEKTQISPDLEVTSNVLSEEENSSSPGSTKEAAATISLSMTANTTSSESSVGVHEEGMPPKSSLLQSVIKERPKIQGKRRPSSRRARQEAIRASSIDADTDTNPPLGVTSPSTDEEDLFGVPPLESVQDNVKTVSPTTDIFGIPTVLSPATKQQLPSSFVSTPFVHSLPPPLDEEEEISIQDDDIFESQDNRIGDIISDKKVSDLKIGVQVQKRSNAEDLFGSVNEDNLFTDIREAPPPLGDDDDDYDNDNDLFMSRDIVKTPSFDKFNDSSSTTTKSVNKSIFDKSNFSDSNSFEPMSSDSLFSSESVGEVVTNDSLFPKEYSVEAMSDDSFFSSYQEPQNRISDNSLFDPADRPAALRTSVLPVSDDLLFTTSNISANIENDELLNISHTIRSEKVSDDAMIYVDRPTISSGSESLFSDNFIRTEMNDTVNLSTTSNKLSVDNSVAGFESCNSSIINDSLVKSEGSLKSAETSVPRLLDAFTGGENVTVSDSKSWCAVDNSLATSRSSIITDSSASVGSLDKTHKDSSHNSLFTPPDSSIADDSLFATPKHSSENSVSTNVSKLNSSRNKDENPVKTDTFFSDDADDKESFSDLFSSKSENRSKTVTYASKKTSLFGDEEEDDDLFGPSSSKQSVTVKKPSSSESSSKGSQPMTGNTTSKKKPGSSGSSKPVKLETKQAFSDPLLSNQD